jgi:uncharacterized membrane protein YdfJ with MMPL/SSD domain
MKHAISRTRRALVGVLGLALAAPLYAHKGQGKGSGGQMGMMGGQGGMGPGAQQSSGMMHDMAAQMQKMSEQMMQGGMGPDMQKQMSERMQEMGAMMEKMSGMMGKGMMDADMQKQMEQMRKRMDEMMKQ